MWRVVRFLVAGLFAVLMALPAGEAVAAAPPAGSAGGVVAAQPVSPTAPVTNAPTGPQLDPAQTEENAAKSKRKTIIAVIAVLLLASVLVGRRMRSKAKKG